MHKRSIYRLIGLFISLVLVIAAIFALELTVGAEAGEGYETIELGTEVRIALNDSDKTSEIFEFTPTESGVYFFYSFDNERDTYGYILDAEGNELLQNDDHESMSNNNFKIICNMTAGETYLLKARFYSPGIGEASIIIEKAESPKSVTINEGEYYSAPMGHTLPLTIAYDSENAYCESVEWISDDPDVASVNESGKVLFKRPGTANVTVKVGEGVTDTITVTVLEPTDITVGNDLALSFSEYTVNTIKFIPLESGWYSLSASFVGNEFTATLLDEDFAHLTNTDDTDFSFYVQHELTAGKAYYLVISADYFSEESLTVSAEKLAPATSMTLNFTEYEGALHERIKLIPIFSPSNAIREEVSYEISNDSISWALNDLLDFDKIGSVTITATSKSGLSAVCEITITEPDAIEICEEAVVTFENEFIRYKTFSISVPESGTYALYSISDLYDPFAYVYPSDSSSYISYDDSAGIDYNFKIVLELEKDADYYCRLGVYNAKSAEYTILLSKADEEGNAIHEIESYSPDTEKPNEYHVGVCTVTEHTVKAPHELNEDYVCIVCNHKHVHDISVFGYIDTEVHEGYCNICKEYVYAEHLFDENGICGCGYFQHEHIINRWNYDDKVHYAHCNICERYIEEEHEFSEGICLCGYYEHEHSFYLYDIYSDYHLGICSICNQYVEEDHEYGENDECAVCGYFEHEHTVDVWKFNSDEHYGFCNYCDTQIYFDHEFSADEKCAVCGYCEHEHTATVYFHSADEHYAHCDICTEIVPEEHEFDSEGKCICGYADHEHSYVEFYIYAEYHELLCEICSLYIYGEHEFDENGNCICGQYDHRHTLGSQKDLYTTYHYGKCTTCGIYFSEDHIFENDACTVCGVMDHEHTFDDYWYDNIEHCLVCSECGFDNYYSDHSFDAEGKCVCGYKKFDGVRIDKVFLRDGQYVDTHGVVSTVPPNGGYAYLKDGILTLSNFTVISENEETIFTYGDLEIVLIGKNKIVAKNEDVIYVLGSLTIGGSGSIEIIAESDYDGIDVKGDLIINDGTYYITTIDNGIEAGESITINGGYLIINAGDDALDAYKTVTLNGGALYLYAEDYGIDAEIVIINDVNLTIVSLTSAGIYAYDLFVMRDGYVKITPDTEGIFVDDGGAHILGGSLDISSDDNRYLLLMAYEKITFGEGYEGYSIKFAQSYFYALAYNGEYVRGSLLIERDDKTVISSENITADDLTHTGKALTPTLSVTSGGATLTEGTDYKVILPASGINEVGEYEIFIAGIGKYTGIEKITVKVNEAPTPEDTPEQTPDQTPDNGSDDEKGGLPTGAIVGIAAGSGVALLSGGFSLFWFVIKKKKWSDLIAIFKK